MAESYSPEGLALEMFQKRYTIHETETWQEAMTRVVNHVSMAESGEARKKFLTESAEILEKNLFMPAGRILYGAGRANAQLLNCFVIPTHDSREGWGKTISDMIIISGTGGGLGINCTPIRPRNSIIRGTGGVATGAVSMMEIIDAAGNVIKDGGGRRSALMFALKLTHGDMLEFLDKKLNLDALTNANVSIIFDEDPEKFFDLVKSNGTFEFKFRGSVIGTIPAKELWMKFIENAFNSGEPGLLNGYLANRMSNIWYLYELVCTNPCTAGDALIATADGRNAVTIKQLAEEGQDIPVYSTNLKTGKTEIKIGRNPRKTGQRKEVWKLTLDDGSSLIATPDHKILKKDLTYSNIKDLVAGDSICPFNSFNSNGYRQITNVGKKMKGGARRNKRQYRLVYEFYHGDIDAKNIAIHHNDFNSLNDHVNNLKLMNRKDHTKLHSDLIRGEKNPYHKMSDSWKRKFASHPKEKNGRYLDVTNEQLLNHGRKLFSKNGKITQELWIKYAKKNSLPQFLGNEFRFSTFTNFKNQVASNHKVIKVEFFGYEDVYNITVDDNNNYHVITSSEDKDFVTSSGICVKNCGEIWMSPYECCCLGSLVLPRFVSGRGIEWDLLKETVKRAVRFLDNVLTVNDYPLKEIAEKSAQTRRIGLGVMGLHDVLLLNNMKYNSPEGLELVDKIMKTIKNYAYEASVELAKEKGAFPAFDAENFCKSKFVKTLKPTIRKMISTHGIRNCALLTIPPTGTTSIVCDVTAGIEPMFAPAYKMRFIDTDDEWHARTVIHPLLKKFIEEGKDVSHFQGAHDMSLRDHFEMQRTCQKHVDNSVSKTINIVDGSTSVEKLSEMYMEYFPELKGVTVYRDGSRENQPLTPIPLDEAVKEAKDALVEATTIDSCKDGSCDI